MTDMENRMKKKARQVSYEHMCTGPCKEREKKLKEKSEYYAMMSNFYSISKEDQFVFMAMFGQMVRNKEDIDT